MTDVAFQVLEAREKIQRASAELQGLERDINCRLQIKQQVGKPSLSPEVDSFANADSCPVADCGKNAVAGTAVPPKG